MLRPGRYTFWDSRSHSSTRPPVGTVDVVPMRSALHGRRNGLVPRTLSGTKTKEIGEQLVGARGTSGKLAPKAEADVQPSPVAIASLHQRPLLDPWIRGERVGEGHKIGVTRISVAEKIEPSLLYPAGPRRV